MIRSPSTTLDRIPLDPDGYAAFYSHSFDPGDAKLPETWMARDADGKSSWKDAPNASFPSYSFSTTRGGGLSVALPVQGVPVGLSLLGSEAANGSISIKQAKTLGIDTCSLYAQLATWAAIHRDFLRNFGREAKSGRQSYLRVVTRVYATGKIDVFLSDASSYAAGADAGAPKPVDLLVPKTPEQAVQGEAVRESYRDNLRVLNDTIANGMKATQASGVEALLPGGSVRVTAATARTVSLSETFDTPLVLGYLGFDCAILPDGWLGPPIATHAVLDPDGDTRPPASPAEVSLMRRLNDTLYDVLAQQAAKPPSPRQQQAAAILARLDALAAAIPAKPFSYRAQGASGFERFDLVGLTVEADPAARTYRDFLSYRGALENAARLLEKISTTDLSDQDRARLETAQAETAEGLRALQDPGLLAREHAAASDAITFVIDLDR